MTSNQVAYWRNVEDARHNLATEKESIRHNFVVEGEDNRHHMQEELLTATSINETNRHNREVEWHMFVGEVVTITTELMRDITTMASSAMKFAG